MKLPRLLYSLLFAVLPVGGVSTPASADEMLGEPHFMPRPDIHRPAPGNLHLRSVLVAGEEAFDGTEFSVWREQPDAYGKMRQTLMAQSGPQAAADFELSPGRYRLQVRNDAVQLERTIDIPTDAALATEVVLDAGELTLWAVIDDSGTPAEAAWFRILRDETDAFGRPTQVQVAGRGYGEQARFVLPAGDYTAEARFGDAELRLPVRVDAGARSEQTLDLQAGRIEVTATMEEGGAALSGVEFTIQPVDGTADALTLTSGDNDTTVAFILPHGDYSVRATLDHAAHESVVRVQAGENQQIEIPLQAAAVTVYATLAGDSDALLDSAFDVVPADASPAALTAEARGPDHMARFVVPAGVHRVVARHGESVGSADIEVAPGESRTLAIDLAAGRVTLALHGQRGGQASPYTWFSVYRIDRDASGRERRRRVYNEGYYASTDVVLPAGDYIAFARSDDQRAERAFHVNPGGDVQIELVAAQQR